MTTPVLHPATRHRLPADIAQPRYDRTAIAPGVVHLGLGNFHRAHQAVWFDDALAAGDGRWGITGVSMRSPAVHDRLRAQDGLYSVVDCDGPVERVRVIGALRQTMVAAENPTALHAAIALPSAHIVTLTVTEKGYGTGPGSPAEHLVAGLALRHRAKLPPLTMISCDNRPENGTTLRHAVLDVALRRDPALAQWIADHAAFPNTMVDRIVPATTDADIARFADRSGLIDRGVVRTEPFRQWVIEDRFAGPRPDFAALGVSLVADVGPWEIAKLRLLNGAHSALAYVGGLAGHAFVHDAIGNPAMAGFIDRLWDETAETLDSAAGIDFAAYRRRLAARFANPALAHRTGQIAIDGSQKLPPRLLAPITWRRARGLDAPALTLAVAGWMRWQFGRDGTGQSFTVDDPLAAVTAQALEGASTPDEAVRALLGIAAVFPPAFTKDQPLVARLGAWLALLLDQGAGAAVAELARQRG